MYVNDFTLDYGESGRKAVQLLLDRAVDAGLLQDRVTVTFVDDGAVV
jgi:predicted solute-binding protein